MINKDYEYDIIFIGRGGQGVVTAAQLLGEIVFLEGYNDAIVVPTFGPERRGAPVEATLRFSCNKIYKLSQPEQADFIFVLDESLFFQDKILKRTKDKCTVIVNSKEKFISKSDISIYKYPITKISLEKKLIVQGLPVVNTLMLGAIAKVTKLITLENINKVIHENFNEKVALKNIDTIKEVYDGIDN